MYEKLERELHVLDDKHQYEYVRNVIVMDLKIKFERISDRITKRFYSNILITNWKFTIDAP